MTTSRSILNDSQRRFGAGRAANAAAIVAGQEKSTQNATGRLAASCSMSSLAYSNDSATTDTSETMRKMSALREKLRKSQENLSRTVVLDQKEQPDLAEKAPSSHFNGNRSKSFGNLSQMQASSIRRDSDDKTPTKEDQTNLRPTKDNLSPHLNRSLATTLNELSKLSQSDLTNIVDKTPVTNLDCSSFYSSTSLPRYRKATPSGVQKKLFQVKARIATGSAGSHVNGASSQNFNNGNRSYSSYTSQPNMTPHRHTSGVDPASFKNAFNASSAGSQSIDIRRSPSDMISAGQRASMSMSSTPVRIRNDGSSPIPNPRRGNYLARLLAEDQNSLGQQQGSSSDRSSSRVESGVAPEIFEGAHFEKRNSFLIPARSTEKIFKSLYSKTLETKSLQQISLNRSSKIEVQNDNFNPHRL
uniref:Uncharacterized protein n=1 Tax=Romanomermis culicivorax TaxID=13658 RepID=A0A915JNW2_ROMCU